MATAEVLNNVDILGPQQKQVNLGADFSKSKDPEATQVAFDPVKLKERYVAERDKRLKHGGGINQYKLVEEGGEYAHYLIDPWVEPGFKREPVKEEVEVMIVGGGYGAQLVAVKLIEAGITNIRLIEKAGGFGGTCEYLMITFDEGILAYALNVGYWNRYPGAQCDIESYIYMPLIEELGFMPTEKYARAKELLRHSQL